MKNKRSFIKSPRLFHRIGRDPYLDWQLIIAMTMFVSLFLISIGLLKYDEVSKTSNATFSAKDPLPSRSFLDAQALEKVIKNYDAKDKETKDLLYSYSGVRDPSQ
jgi:hypothetical protein